MTREEFCLNLSNLRKSLNIGFQDMVILAKTGSSVISRVDKGKNNFNLKTLLLYLNAMNYSMFIDGKKISSGDGFSAFVKSLRADRKITQSEFGKIVGVAEVSVLSLERNNANPRIDTILDISNAFNLSVDLRKNKK